MAKERRLTVRLLLPVIAAGIIGIWFVRLRSVSDPIYDGKPLSEWLDVLTVDSPAEEQLRAKQAVKSIGTNALPLLMRRLSHSDNLFQTIFYSPWGRQDLPHEFRMRDSAAKGFQALGPIAAVALPDLTNLISCVPQAELALGAIGTAGLPSLVAGLNDSNAQVRAYAIAGLHSLPVE